MAPPTRFAIDVNAMSPTYPSLLPVRTQVLFCHDGPTSVSTPPPPSTLSQGSQSVMVPPSVTSPTGTDRMNALAVRLPDSWLVVVKGAVTTLADMLARISPENGQIGTGNTCGSC